MSRFTIDKSESPRKPWVVTDKNTDPAEDPTIYRFTSRRKAETFLDAMIAEHGNTLAADAMGGV